MTETQALLIIVATWAYLVAGLVTLVAITSHTGYRYEESADCHHRHTGWEVYTLRDWLLWPVTLLLWYRARQRARRARFTEARS